MKGKVMVEMKCVFCLEFLNCIDEIIVFYLLEKFYLVEIVKLMVD